jgi:N6-adenosine-specific RNA methylase IME4
MKGIGKFNDTRQGRVKQRGGEQTALPYPTMTVEEIKGLPVGCMAEPDAHLWLWTTNAFLEDGFAIMRAWGFRYLAPIHWVKPSGFGCWFVHRTQTILFGYRQKCRFPQARFRPNIFMTGNPPRHSEKPEEAFALIESVSPGPYLELFARRKRQNWTCWGNEVDAGSSIELTAGKIEGKQ